MGPAHDLHEAVRSSYVLHHPRVLKGTLGVHWLWSNHRLGLVRWGIQFQRTLHRTHRVCAMHAIQGGWAIRERHRVGFSIDQRTQPCILCIERVPDVLALTGRKRWRRWRQRPCRHRRSQKCVRVKFDLLWLRVGDAIDQRPQVFALRFVRVGLVQPVARRWRWRWRWRWIRLRRWG